MAQNMAKASERVLNATTRVDVAALSPAARGDTMYIPLTTALPIVQATTKLLMLPVFSNALVVNGASLVYTTVPVVAGGTATIQIDYVAVDGSTTTNIVAATSVLALTNKVPLALTLAATNPASCAAGGSILVTVVTSNNAVGTADIGGGLTIGYQGVDPNPITD